MKGQRPCTRTTILETVAAFTRDPLCLKEEPIPMIVDTCLGRRIKRAATPVDIPALRVCQPLSKDHTVVEAAPLVDNAPLVEEETLVEKEPVVVDRPSVDDQPMVEDEPLIENNSLTEPVVASNVSSKVDSNVEIKNTKNNNFPSNEILHASCLRSKTVKALVELHMDINKIPIVVLQRLCSMMLNDDAEDRAQTRRVTRGYKQSQTYKSRRRPKNRKIKCRTCSITLKGINKMALHKLLSCNIRSISKKVGCSQCPESFDNNTQLLEHLKQHIDASPPVENNQLFQKQHLLLREKCAAQEVVRIGYKSDSEASPIVDVVTNNRPAVGINQPKDGANCGFDRNKVIDHLLQVAAANIVYPSPSPVQVHNSDRPPCHSGQTNLVTSEPIKNLLSETKPSTTVVKSRIKPFIGLLKNDVKSKPSTTVSKSIINEYMLKKNRYKFIKPRPCPRMIPFETSPPWDSMEPNKAAKHSSISALPSTSASILNPVPIHAYGQLETNPSTITLQANPLVQVASQNAFVENYHTEVIKAETLSTCEDLNMSEVSVTSSDTGNISSSLFTNHASVETADAKLMTLPAVFLGSTVTPTKTLLTSGKGCTVSSRPELGTSCDTSKPPDETSLIRRRRILPNSAVDEPSDPVLCAVPIQSSSDVVPDREPYMLSNVYYFIPPPGKANMSSQVFVLNSEQNSKSQLLDSSTPFVFSVADQAVASRPSKNVEKISDTITKYRTIFPKPTEADTKAKLKQKIKTKTNVAGKLKNTKKSPHQSKSALKSKQDCLPVSTIAKTPGRISFRRPRSSLAVKVVSKSVAPGFVPPSACAASTQKSSTTVVHSETNPVSSEQSWVRVKRSHVRGLTPTSSTAPKVQLPSWDTCLAD